MHLIQPPLILLLGCEILAFAAPVDIPTPSPNTIEHSTANSPIPTPTDKFQILTVDQQSIDSFSNSNKVKESIPLRDSELPVSPPIYTDLDQLHNNPDLLEYCQATKYGQAKDNEPAPTMIKKRQRFEYEDYNFDRSDEEESNVISLEENPPSATIPISGHIAELLGYGVHPDGSQGDEEEQDHILGKEFRYPVTTPASDHGYRFDYIYGEVDGDGEKERDSLSSEESVLSALPTPTPTPDPATFTSYGDYGNYGAYGSYGKYGTYKTY